MPWKFQSLFKNSWTWGTPLLCVFALSLQDLQHNQHKPHKVTSEGPHCETKGAACNQW